MSEDKGFRLNALDRAIGWFAPQTAGRRAMARMMLGTLEKRSLQSGYEGASTGRRSGNWQPRVSSADREIRHGGPMLRRRLHDLARNAPFAAEAITAWTDYLVGAGIEPRAKTGDPSLDDRINKLWAEWSPHADSSGPWGFHGLIALAVRSMVEGGDVFLRRRARSPEDDLPVPLQIQLYEAEHLDESRMTFLTGAGGMQTRYGIEYDALDRRSAYWLFREHPGDAGVLRSLESVRVPARFVAHLYRRDRVQQRGVPWGAAVVQKLYELDSWAEADLTRKKIEACMVAFVSNADAGDEALTPGKVNNASPYATDVNGALIEEFEPGLIAYLNGNKRVDFVKPENAGGVAEWNRVQQHAIAAGWGMPYEVLTGDLSQVNYSSIRTGMIKFRQRVDRYQWQIVIPIACQRIWDWFVEAAFDAGKLPVPRAAVEWAPPKYEEVDREKELRADLMEIRSGITTLPAVIAKRGYDWKEIFAEHAEWRALAKELGLVLEADPAQVSGAGVTQAPAMESEPPVDPGEDE